MIDLIIYINDLKSQLFEKSFEYNLYNNLMKILRQLFKNEIIRRKNAILSRKKLKEIVRLAEKTIQDDNSKFIRERFEYDSDRYHSYDKFKTFDSTQKILYNDKNRDRNDSNKNRDRFDIISYDKFKIECYDCEKKSIVKMNVDQQGNLRSRLVKKKSFRFLDVVSIVQNRITRNKLCRH
jgi:hypothetical protein